LDFGTFHLPRYLVPDGHTLDSYLRELSAAGLRRRYGPTPGEALEARLAHELAVVEKMGFAGYFLVVWDFIHYAREQGIAVGPDPRRGARARPALRRRGPDRQARPELPAQHHARRRLPEVAPARRDGEEPAERSGALGDRAHAGGLHPPRLGPRVGGRHLRRATRRAHPALQGPQAPGADHRLRDGADREARAPQDGLPRARDPDGAGEH